MNLIRSIKLCGFVAILSLTAGMVGSPAGAAPGTGPGTGDPPGRPTPIPPPDPGTIDGSTEPPPYCGTRLCGLRVVTAYKTDFNSTEDAIWTRAICPAGYIVVGGGAETYGFLENSYLNASRPAYPENAENGDENFDAQPIGWYGLAGKRHPDNQPPSISVWAMCLPAQ